MESFDPRCITVLRKKYPHIIRGQLSENYAKAGSRMNPVLAFVLTHYLTNFMTVPDFVAYRFDHRIFTPSNNLCRKLWKAQGVTWTLRSPEEHASAVKEGWIPIFENYIP